MNTLSFLFTFAGLTATIAFTFTSKTTTKTIPSSVSSSSILVPTTSIKSFINTKLYQQSNDSDNDNDNDNDEEQSELDSIILSKVSKHFKSNLLYTYTLTNHKPLGCTAEESLYQGGDNAINDNAQIDFSNEDGTNTKFVFISKLIPGGYAASVGLEVGDLIVGLSGTFDELEDVFGEGLDRVRSLIAGRPEEKALTIKIIRNTDVLAKHESALIDLCTLPEGQLYGRDKTIETCIETMYTMNYDVDIDDTDGSDIASACGDDDMECMLDTISNLWNDDVDDNDNDFEERKRKEEDEKKRNEMKKPAPWSSRSSPSGTYVRVNGTMVNIDE